nr:MAG TPA: Vpu protein [Bacteriophage sp.]
MAYPWKKCVENYRERLSEKVCSVKEEDFEEKLLMDLEKRPDGNKISAILNNPIILLPPKYRDAYYLLFKKEEDYIPPDRRIKMVDSDKIYDKLYLNIRLINVIRNNILKKDKNITDKDVIVVPYYSMLEDTDVISGCITFFKSKEYDKFIEDVGLFSFDIENKTYGSQIWKDFDNCLKDYLEEGWTVSWIAYKQNKACRHYDRLIEELNGKKEDQGSVWRYWFLPKKYN